MKISEISKTFCWKNIYYIINQRKQIKGKNLVKIFLYFVILQESINYFWNWGFLIKFIE